MFTPLILPNGSRLPNRLAKAALEENLADEGQLPGPAGACIATGVSAAPASSSPAT